MKTLIIDNFDSFTYNLYQYCAELKANPIVFKNNEISIDQILKGKFTHIIISPGPGTPQKKEDFGVCADVIKKLKGKIPILGVCLGHQGIIYHLGGKIIKAPYPIHGKQSELEINNSHPLFKSLPKNIDAMRYHSLNADPKSLPKTLTVIAKTKDNLIMAVSHKSLPLFGVQFHPESIGTKNGMQILKNFFKISAKK